VRSSSGAIERHAFKRVIAPATGKDALTKKQASRLAWDLILSKLDQATLRPQSLCTVEEFVKVRFEPDVVWRCRPAGQDHYKYLLKVHVLPAIGKLRLRDVCITDVQKLVREKIEAGLSVQTAVHVRNCVSAIFRHAKRVGFYSGELPTEGVQLPHMVRRERRALNWEQAKAIIERLPAPVEQLVLLLTLTGLRIGEACGLRWKHVDFTASVIVVEQTYRRGKYGPPKKESSIRRLPLVQSLAAELAALKASTRWAGPDDPAFANEIGRPLNQNNVLRRVLKPLVKAKGLPWVSWHSFRHTNASLADQVGLTVVERKKVLGHADDRMAMHYSHADLDLVRERMELMAARLVTRGKVQ
jgi:integrase